ncbi:unnamed protein product [Sphagnum balticum]
MASTSNNENSLQRYTNTTSGGFSSGHGDRSRSRSRNASYCEASHPRATPSPTHATASPVPVSAFDFSFDGKVPDNYIYYNPGRIPQDRFEASNPNARNPFSFRDESTSDDEEEFPGLGGVLVGKFIDSRGLKYRTTPNLVVAYFLGDVRDICNFHVLITDLDKNFMNIGFPAAAAMQQGVIFDRGYQSREVMLDHVQFYPDFLPPKQAPIDFLGELFRRWLAAKVRYVVTTRTPM